MEVEITVSRAAANAVYGLVAEYLHQGGSGHDREAIEEFIEALGDGDRLIIRDDICPPKQYDSAAP